MTYSKDAEYSAYNLTSSSKADLLDLLEQAVASLRDEIESGEEADQGTYAYTNITAIAYAMRNLDS